MNEELRINLESEISLTNRVDLSNSPELDDLYEWFESFSFPDGFELADEGVGGCINIGKHFMPNVLFKECKFEENYMFELKLGSKDGSAVCGTTIFDGCKFEPSCNIKVTVENWDGYARLFYNHLFNNMELPAEGTVTVNIVRTENVDDCFEATNTFNVQLFKNMYIGPNVYINLVGYKDTDLLNLTKMFSNCTFGKGFNFRDNVSIDNPKVSKQVDSMLDTCKLREDFFIPASFFKDSRKISISPVSHCMPFSRSTYQCIRGYRELPVIMGISGILGNECNMNIEDAESVNMGVIPPVYKPVMNFITTQGLEERCKIALKSVMQNRDLPLDRAYTFLKSMGVFSESILESVRKDLSEDLLKFEAENVTECIKSMVRISKNSSNGRKMTIGEIRSKVLEEGYDKDTVNECLLTMLADREWD